MNSMQIKKIVLALSSFFYFAFPSFFWLKLSGECAQIIFVRKRRIPEDQFEFVADLFRCDKVIPYTRADAVDN